MCAGQAQDITPQQGCAGVRGVEQGMVRKEVGVEASRKMGLVVPYRTVPKYWRCKMIRGSNFLWLFIAVCVVLIRGRFSFLIITMALVVLGEFHLLLVITLSLLQPACESGIPNLPMAFSPPLYILGDFDGWKNKFSWYRMSG